MEQVLEEILLKDYTSTWLCFWKLESFEPKVRTKSWPGINSAEIIPHFEVTLVHFFECMGQYFFENRIQGGRGLIQ